MISDLHRILLLNTFAFSISSITRASPKKARTAPLVCPIPTFRIIRKSVRPVGASPIISFGLSIQSARAIGVDKDKL